MSDRALEAALAADAALGEAEEMNEATMAEARRILKKIEDTYSHAVESADETFASVLADSTRRRPLSSRAFAMRNAGYVVHRRAVVDAETVRRASVQRAFPGVAAAEYPESVSLLSVLYATHHGWPAGPEADYPRGTAGPLVPYDSDIPYSDVLDRYKSDREAADAGFKEAVLEALKTDTGDLKNHVQATRAALEAARRARDAAVDAVFELLVFGEEAARRVRSLEGELRDRLVAAARGSRGRSVLGSDSGGETASEETGPNGRSGVGGDARSQLSADGTALDVEIAKRLAEAPPETDDRATGVVGSRPAAASRQRTTRPASAADAGSTTDAECLIPGFPRPADPENLGLPWCPASVDFQIRSTALVAAGMQCAIATGTSSTPDQIAARMRETADLCARLDALNERLGGADCRCPADWR